MRIFEFLRFGQETLAYRPKCCPGMQFAWTSRFEDAVRCLACGLRRDGNKEKIVGVEVLALFPMVSSAPYIHCLAGSSWGT